MVLATSIAPNLWLVGSILGGAYGSKVAKRQQQLDEEEEEEDDYDDDDEEEDDGSVSLKSREQGAVASAVLKMGRKLALTYLDLYDKVNIMFFMYKTGQLSYQVRSPSVRSDLSRFRFSFFFFFLNILLIFDVTYTLPA